MNFLGVNILLHIDRNRGEKLETKHLVKRAKKGDKEALLCLVMSKKSDYYKLAYVYMKNKEDALDAIQDMIIILYENINSLKKDDSFYSWSKTILVNSCKKILARKKKVVYLEHVDEYIGQTYESFEDQDDKIVLENYLSKLNPIHQEVIRLRYLLDLDYETIAQILKIPIGTVKSRISAGMKYLKEMVGGEHENG